MRQIIRQWNARKPICGLMILIALLWTSDHLHAVTPISPGDRILMLGNQWVENGTALQSGFEVIRLSSYKPDTTLMKISNNPNLKLAIGLAEGADSTMVPPNGPWPGDAGYAYLDFFRRKLTQWLSSGIDISMIQINLEYPYDAYSDRHSNEAFLIQALTDTMAILVKDYRRTITEVCDSLSISPTPALWVFSSKAASYDSYEELGCDWDALTSGNNPIDACCIGGFMDVPGDSSGTPQLIKDAYSDGINEVKTVSNGKPVIVQLHTRGDLPNQYRNRYHLNWNIVRELARYAKNVSQANSSNFSGNHPVTYFQGHYSATIYTPYYVENLNYTQDISGTAPTIPFPWEDGHRYPARLWENGYEGDWVRNQFTPNTNQPHNIWEREVIANILTATGTPLTGHQLASNTTWSGTAYLIGDVVVPDGVTLTIEAGTTINFRPDTDVYEAGQDDAKAEIIVEGGGTLYAVGSVNSPIVFQSAFRADENDTPGNDDWQGIRVEKGGTLQLQNCAIYDAKVGVDVEPSDSDQYITTLQIRETDFWWNYKGIKIQAEAQPPEFTALENIGMFYNLSGLETSTYSTTQNDIDMVNWTLSDNFQGFAVTSTGSAHQRVRIKNTILSYNDYGAYAQYPAQQNVDIAFTYSDIYQNPTTFHGHLSGWSVPPSGTGNVDDDPEFVDRNGYDYHLNISSPLLDAGDPGMADPDQSIIEMGRYGGTDEHTSAGSYLVYEEDFNDDAAQGWTVVEGNWAIKTVDSGKRYVMESSSQNVNRSYVQVTGWSGGYAVEALIKFHGEEGKLIYSKANQNERYRVDLMANSGNFRLMIDDNAYGYGMTINRNTWYTVKVVVRSDSVKTYLNGTLRHAVGASGAPDGYIGVGSYDGNPGSLSDHVLADDVKVWSGAVSKPAVLLAVEPNPDLPMTFAVGQNFPNPFNPETTIVYALPQALDVRLVIYNALGQEVRTLINGVQPAGFHRIVWDSRDALGRQVSSGIYLYRIVAGEFVETRKMLILK